MNPTQAFSERVNTYGSVPLAKFGHCCCMITKERLIVFGGASGNVGNFAITNDTFCLDMVMEPLTLTWRKLDSSLTPDQTTAPSPVRERLRPAPTSSRTRCFSWAGRSDVDLE